MKAKKHLSLVEPLEDRIAPATIINPYTVTYQDYDNGSANGTAVVHISKPLFKNAAAAEKILIFTTSDGSTENFTGNSVAESLTTINLLGRTDAQGMSISVKAVPQVGVGNGLVNVDNIAAGNISNFTATHNIDLGSVYIGGNLGSISVGDHFSTPALTSLTVQSMGPTSASNGQSFVLGPILKLNIAGNMTGYLDLIGYQFGTINKLTIGGSLEGDSAGTANAGLIQFQGRIGSATIGNIIGGTGADSGALLGANNTASRIGTLDVLGSITGNSGAGSGQVFANVGINKITVKGSVTGGSGESSALIAGPISNINIAGSLTGGSGVHSGSIIGESFASNGDSFNLGIGTVTIGGNVTGGTAGSAASGSTAAVHGYSGVIEAFSAKSISIGGSLVGGNFGFESGTTTPDTSHTADTSGSILVNSVSTLSITGGITGGTGPSSGIVTGTGGFNTMAYGNITIGSGGITGGSGIQSGSILIDTGTIGTLQVGGSVTGGDAGTAAAGSTAAVSGFSGVIEAISAKAINIQGSLVGGNADSGGAASISGAILVNSLNSLTINHGITGGSGPTSGVVTGTSLFTSMKYGSVTVNGDVTGGSGAVSGSILVNGVLGGSLANLRVGGSLTGGSETQSGQVYTTTALSALYVGGSVTGGTASDTGEILSGGTLTSGIIKGNLAGSTAIDSATTPVVGSGYIAAGSITSLTIGGSVSSGMNSGAAAIANVGAIRSTSNIVSLTIDGAVTGNAANPFIISATEGPITPGKQKTDLAIKSVTIQQNATYLDLLAGYSPTVSTTSNNTTNAAGAPLGTPTDGTAQIGDVVFGMNLSASNVVAGATPDSNGQFGTTGNSPIAPPQTGKTALISSIASIIVGGNATGDSTPTDSFGFVAQQFGSIQVNTSTTPTSVTPVSGTPVAVSGSNLFVYEIPS